MLRPRNRWSLNLVTLLALVVFGSWIAPARQGSNLTYILESAERALDAGQLETAHKHVMRALERDAKSLAAWTMRARVAAAGEQLDEQLFSMHRHYLLAEAQGLKKRDLKELQKEISLLDPFAKDVFGLKENFLDKLQPLAQAYEKDGRPHSAIRVHKEILALDPQNAESQAAIERIASSPDPSLAGDAKPKDLLADVSEEWVREFDEEHKDWKTRAKLDRKNYVTYTDAGYEVMVRAAEAMEQMNAFYRVFFNYGLEGQSGSVPKISLHIFRDRDEYLSKGIGPPVEWSGGHFTGNAVETYIGPGGFEEMTGTLFHEAAHQFVSLATSASGWLNEGLASFFEGTRILSNGTVIMNLPANHRLFPLADRMENGWMTDENDGIDPANANATPTKAPTFRIIVENRYQWGPPWYAPTWGLVYFLYNYQDRVDGRFVYRRAFGEFMNSSGGRMGDGAVDNFEETVLQNPQPPTKGAAFDEALVLPESISDLDRLWKDWTLELRDIQIGQKEVERPYLTWAQNAVTREEIEVAAEHFEKGLLATPEDMELLRAFADFLAEFKKDEDRATSLLLRALRIVETSEEPDEKLIVNLERQLAKWDKRQEKLNDLHDEIQGLAMSVSQRYLAAGRPMMAMDVSWRLGEALDAAALFGVYSDALEAAGKSNWIWQLAYNEENLKGWSTAAGTSFEAAGTFLTSDFKSANSFDYQFLTLDTVTSGDFSMQAQVQVDKGKVGFAGLVFGQKSAQAFHALILYPPHDTKAGDQVLEQPPSVDLTSFYGPNDFRIWRHAPAQRKVKQGESASAEWHDLRIDVVGSSVDIWVDGEFTASQDFGDPSVMRGSFGLITAPGQARFRDVRYLERPPRDPGAAVERRLRMEELKERGGDTGSVSGSYLGMVPPLPDAERWVTDELESWDNPDRPRVRLIALWSIQQNDLMPIDGWLRQLDKTYGPQGLEIVSIMAATDDEGADAYLKSHQVPGFVCVDRFGETGIGETFVDFAIERFNLPRLLLLDLDGKVVWEGDPGFSIGAGYSPGQASYLDSPLKELIEKRSLTSLISWHKDWAAAQTQLAQGDFAGVISVIDAASAFDPKLDKTVAHALAMRGAVEISAADPMALLDDFNSRGAGAAVPVLIEWGAAVGITYKAKVNKELKKLEREAQVRDWDKVVTECRRLANHLGTERESSKLDELEALLAEVSGLLPARMLTDLKAARANGGDVATLIDQVSDRPASWLVAEYFAW